MPVFFSYRGVLPSLLLLLLCGGSMSLAQSPADTLRWSTLYQQYVRVRTVNPDSAMHYARQSLTVARNTGYNRGLALSYNAIGSVYSNTLFQPVPALAYFDSAEACKIPVKRTRAAILMGKAQAHTLLERYAVAAQELLQAIALFEQPPADSANLGSALNNLASLIMKQNDCEGALRTYRSALAIARKSKDLRLEGNVLGNMSSPYVELGQYDSAEAVLKAAIVLNHQAQAPTAVISNELNLGVVLIQKYQYAAARPHFLTALELLKTYPNYYRMVNGLSNLAHTYQQNQPSKGLEYAKRAEAMLDSLPPGSWEWKRNLFKITSDLYEKTRNFEQAHHYASLAYDAADSMYHNDQRNKVALERENYEVNKRDAQLAAMATTQAVATTQRNWGIAVAGLFLVFAAFATVNARRRRTLNRQLAEVNTDLKATNAIKDRIMSILSHDLRAPLNTLNSFLLLSRVRDIPAAQRERAERQLSSQLQSTIVMLDNLLRWSLTQVKGRSAQPTPIEVKEMVEHALEPLLGLIEMKSLHLVMDLPEALTVYADRDMAVFIVRNLATNAIKFSPTEATIALAAKPDNSLIIISVQDQGPGMDPEKIRTLFSMEENSSTTGTAKERGTGIGLPLAAEMAQQNGGSLHVSSQPGAGSTFALMLPAGS